mmetsp:Transcript_10489/g.29672  ORF Transcript_10489/g.29672 Transcript_10489/m.29672 type:complete len:253 (-) Transcript_10489:158-916(-)
MVSAERLLISCLTLLASGGVSSFSMLGNFVIWMMSEDFGWNVWPMYTPLSTRLCQTSSSTPRSFLPVVTSSALRRSSSSFAVNATSASGVAIRGTWVGSLSTFSFWISSRSWFTFFVITCWRSAASIVLSSAWALTSARYGLSISRVSWTSATMRLRSSARCALSALVAFRNRWSSALRMAATSEKTGPCLRVFGMTWSASSAKMSILGLVTWSRTSASAAGRSSRWRQTSRSCGSSCRSLRSAGTGSATAS